MEADAKYLVQDREGGVWSLSGEVAAKDSWVARDQTFLQWHIQTLHKFYCEKAFRESLRQTSFRRRRGRGGQLISVTGRKLPEEEALALRQGSCVAQVCDERVSEVEKGRGSEAAGDASWPRQAVSEWLCGTHKLDTAKRSGMSDDQRQNRPKGWLISLSSSLFSTMKVMRTVCCKVGRALFVHKEPALKSLTKPSIHRLPF